MPIDPSLLEIHTHPEPGYRPLVDFQAWRVAVLNHIDELLPENLKDLQRHDETDEVFVLLRGRCILFIGDGRDEAGTVQAVDLEPLKVYNVKQGVWHNHTLSEDAAVLVVENRDTTLENSPFCRLSPEQRAWVVAETGRLWEQGEG
jgi:mannose-6-phosphate isomerase-like protein (cupin superfamily)